MEKKSRSNEIEITRIYDAPIETVWDAWTDPAQVAQWWGPRGFTLTTHSKDLRPGGHWDYTMHGPDGTDYPNVTKYFEVEPNALLVYDHGGSRDRPPLFRVRVEFKETDGKTEMKMAMILPTPEAAEDTKKFIKQANGYSTWDRLAEYLAKQTSGKDPFVINRSFEVSRDVMFEMWTNPKHFSQWIAPSGFTTEFFKADIRSGASSFYMMTNGVYTMYGRAHYIEVRKPDQLVYTQQFCDDKNEKTSRHPLAPTWPETMKTVVTFTEEGPRTTRVTIEWEVYGEATSDERKTFHDGKTGMNQGWSGSFDKLEDYLSNR